MSRRGRRQWCYWLSLGAVTLFFCIHWMRDNVNSVSSVESRRKHVLHARTNNKRATNLNINAKRQKSKVVLLLNKRVGTNDSLLDQKKAVVRNVQNIPHSKSHEMQQQSTVHSQRKMRKSNESRQDQKKPGKNNPMKPKKVIILMAQRNSGSSMIKRMFTVDRETMVFDEPLFPCGLNCSSLGEYKTTLLGQFLSCNFTNLQSLYAEGFNLSGVQDSAKCIENGLCFAGKELLREYSKICSRVQKFRSAASDNSTSLACGFPLKKTILHEQCKNAKAIFAKVTRVCAVDQLHNVYGFLKNEGMAPYIIHLVRDPRSMMFSRTNISTKISVTKGRTICARIRKNLNITDEHLSDEAPELIKDGRYMRIRFEDLAADEIGWAKKVYQFIRDGVMPLEVEKFLHGNLSAANEKVRKSNESKPKTPLDKSQEAPVAEISKSVELLQKWRADIPFEMVSVVQKDCGDVMKALGYISFNTEEELRNTSLPFFT